MDTTVLDLPAPAAVRLRRPGWRDPRLLVGLVLIAASVALGSWAVGTAQRTVPVWVARDALTPGDALRTGDLVVADVRLGAAAGGYLRADTGLPQDSVVLRTVGAGELVPVASVGAADALEVRPVAVPLSAPASRGLVPGASVDVWWTPAGADAVEDGGEAAEGAGPRQLAGGLTVAEVSAPDGAFGSGGARSVHLLVPVDDLPAVLAALAGDGVVDVVPVPGSGG
ncbi:hypothetical protein [Cellulomonas shaoxiangyii]|uniref:SAF domain-containing protein n=1 Tax=Cellulomonas shaoxiangyii TaxID=2566013 RepID=A0A4V1CMJ6_9CELL|nr:hypothetical protein [Cellulomonas shaoxiangyii]QCB93175.1 hypothetical protein E5225_06010 [Cellulomonas shaoxiangyii]TGY81181.1 hypothetical protein E5226_14555 [Cellulomonas shaoxiangyii]